MLISEYYREYTDQKKFWLGYALEGLGEGVTLYNYAVGLKK